MIECSVCGQGASRPWADCGAWRECTGKLCCGKCWDNVVVTVLEVAARPEGRDARAREGHFARALLLRAGQASRTR